MLAKFWSSLEFWSSYSPFANFLSGRGNFFSQPGRQYFGKKFSDRAGGQFFFSAISFLNAEKENHFFSQP